MDDAQPPSQHSHAIHAAQGGYNSLGGVASDGAGGVTGMGGPGVISVGGGDGPAQAMSRSAVADLYEVRIDTAMTHTESDGTASYTVYRIDVQDCATGALGAGSVLVWAEPCLLMRDSRVVVLS